MPNPQVPPEGPTDSPWLAIVGEAPGAEEVSAMRPFVGSAGRLLGMMLSAAGVPRGECYITNVSKERPPGNNFKARYYNDNEPTQELLALHDQLAEELRRVKPKVILALGAEALRALTPYTSIKNYRGTMIEFQGFRILPTYHPSYILRGMTVERPVVEADIRKAYRQARNPSKPKTFFNINPTFEEVCRLLRERPAKIALDIETVNLETRMIGIAWSKHEALTIPLFKGRNHAWTLDQEAEILFGLGKLLRSRDTAKVIQNLNFDYTILARDFGFEINNITQDTMLAQHLLYPELPKGLDFLCSIYTDHEMYWNYDSKSHDQTAFYCCKDCVVTFEASEELEQELIERNMLSFYQNIVLPGTLALMRIQSRGINVDVEAREKLRATAMRELDEIRHRLTSTLGFDLNPQSPKQVSELLYGKWKLPKQLNPKTKTPTTDDDALKALAKKSGVGHVQKVIGDILAHRQKRVLISTFLEMNLAAGKVHTSYNIGGTVTGRLASRATIDDVGGNLQNIPRGPMRKIFKPDPGKVLIKADLSQAEYRVLIWRARITRVIDRWQNEPGFNIHMWNASENIYRVPISAVTKEMYQNAKNGVYGANYGIGPHKVSRMYNIPFQDAKFIISRYHEAVPEVQAVYQSEIRAMIDESREIINPLGRRRIFFGLIDDELYRAAYSHYCQSTVADVINSAMIELEYSTYEPPFVEVLLQVHDELVCQCPIEHAEAGVAKIRKAMERPIIIEGRALTIPAEIKLGPSWGETMELNEWKQSLLTSSQPSQPALLGTTGP